jgi:hypothetical protein
VLSAPGAYALVIAERGGRLQLTIVGAPGEDDGVEVKIEPIGALIETTDGLSRDMTGEKERSEQRVESRPVQRSARRHRPPAIVGGFSVSGGVELPPNKASQPVVGARRRTAERDGTGARQKPAPGSGEAERTVAPELNKLGFGFACHVARKGDIGAAGGEWIGGPKSPSVIEGLALHWEKTHGVELEYQVLVAGAQGKWSAWVLNGSFAGTRGRGLPIVGLRVRLAGDSAKSYLLRGEAIFLGLPVVVESGESLELSSYASADPLVGLKLDLHRVDETNLAAAAEQPAVSATRDNKIGGNLRLRVFKSFSTTKSAVELR